MPEGKSTARTESAQPSKPAPDPAGKGKQAKKATEPVQLLQKIVRDFVASNAKFAERGRNSPLFPAIADATFDGINAAASAMAERALRQIEDAPPTLAEEWARQTEALAVPEMLRTADQLIAQIPIDRIYLNLNEPQPTLLDCIKDLLKCIVKALPFLPPLVTEIFCCLYEAACCFARL